MRLALVTETYPPEVKGVAMTLSRLVGGLRARGNQVQVVRPRQKHERTPVPSGDFVVPGMAIPFYNSLRIGLPAVARLEARWREWRPDLVHVATEGDFDGRLHGGGSLVARLTRFQPSQFGAAPRLRGEFARLGCGFA